MLVIYTPKPISARQTLPLNTHALWHRGDEQLSPRLHQRAASQRQLQANCLGELAGVLFPWCLPLFVGVVVFCLGFFKFTFKRVSLRCELPFPSLPAPLPPPQAASLEPRGWGQFGSKHLQPLHLLPGLSFCSASSLSSSTKLAGSLLQETLEHLIGFPLGP